jgi:hypothetical protein
MATATENSVRIKAAASPGYPIPEVFWRLLTWIAVHGRSVGFIIPMSLENSHSRVYFGPWNTARSVVMVASP